jgi:hypothetical protein
MFFAIEHLALVRMIVQHPRTPPNRIIHAKLEPNLHACLRDRREKSSPHPQQ